MNNAQKNEENAQVLIAEPVMDEFAKTEEAVEALLPAMNVSMPQATTPVQGPENALISDEKYLNVVDEILTNIRDDRKQITEFIDTFADMVLNDGDATTSSKEALINLIKAKTDLQDKMLKAADLMTRVKLKNAYAFSGPHLNALQQNNINIGSETNFDRKEIIRAINHAKKKKD